VVPTTIALPAAAQIRALSALAAGELKSISTSKASMTSSRLATM
jgi:hypothetical protein